MCVGFFLCFFQTLPLENKIDPNQVTHIWNRHPKFGVSLHLKHWAQNCIFFCGFTTTVWLKCRSLQNEMCCRQTKKRFPTAPLHIPKIWWTYVLTNGWDAVDNVHLSCASFCIFFIYMEVAKRNWNFATVQHWARCENGSEKFGGFVPLKHGTSKLPISRNFTTTYRYE